MDSELIKNFKFSPATLPEVTSSNQSIEQDQRSEIPRQVLSVDNQQQENYFNEVKGGAPQLPDNQDGGELSQNLVQVMEQIERRLRSAKTFSEKREIYFEFKNHKEAFAEFVKIFFVEDEQENAEDQTTGKAVYEGDENSDLQVNGLQCEESGLRHSQTEDQDHLPTNEMQQLAINDRAELHRQPYFLLRFEHINQTLMHTTQCAEEPCVLAPCESMKMDLKHLKVCTLKGNCPICNQLASVCGWHSIGCTNKECAVPFCLKIHRKTNEMKRRAAKLPKKIKVGRRWVRNPARPPHNLPFLCGGCSLDLFQ